MEATDLRSEFSSMDLDTLKDLKRKYERMANIANEVFEERYASQGFPQYDALPPEIKQEILKYNPVTSQLVSKESKALTDRYMIEFCNQPVTNKELENYFSTRSLSLIITGMRAIVINNKSYMLTLHEDPFGDDSFTLKPILADIPFGKSLSGSISTYPPETYYDILSQRRQCTKKNKNYAGVKTYELFEKLLNDPLYWREYTVFLFLLNPGNIGNIDQTMERWYTFSEPFIDSKENILNDLKLKYK